MNVPSAISVEVDFSVESHDMILGHVTIQKIYSLTENVSLGLHYRDLSTEDLSAEDLSANYIQGYSVSSSN